MGYTHYWRQQRDVSETEWTVFTFHLNRLLNHAKSEMGIDIWRESYDSCEAPLVDRCVVLFNGAGDDGHESFFLTRVKDSNFEFCKTAHKPYDVVVVAALIMYNHCAPGAHIIESDGCTDDWREGLTLAQKILKTSPPLDLPEGIKPSRNSTSTGRYKA